MTLPRYASRSIDSLVDEQVRRWGLEQKRRTVEGRVEPPLPLVTVSREYGAGGSEVARRVSNRLEFSFWDRELLDAVSRETGATEALLKSLDERVQSSIEEVLQDLSGGERGVAHKYVREVARLVHTVRNHGAAVIVGRGATYLLTPDQALRVRVICPLDRRVATYAEREGLHADTARATVTQMDEVRRAFVQRHYGEDVADVHNYDVVVNTGTMTVDQATGVVVGAYRARFGDRTRARTA